MALPLRLPADEATELRAIVAQRKATMAAMGGAPTLSTVLRSIVSGWLVEQRKAVAP